MTRGTVNKRAQVYPSLCGQHITWFILDARPCLVKLKRKQRKKTKISKRTRQLALDHYLKTTHKGTINLMIAMTATFIRGMQHLSGHSMCVSLLLQGSVYSCCLASKKKPKNNHPFGGSKSISFQPFAWQQKLLCDARSPLPKHGPKLLKTFKTFKSLKPSKPQNLKNKN